MVETLEEASVAVEAWSAEEVVGKQIVVSVEVGSHVLSVVMVAGTAQMRAAVFVLVVQTVAAALYFELVAVVYSALTVACSEFVEVYSAIVVVYFVFAEVYSEFAVVYFASAVVVVHAVVCTAGLVETLIWVEEPSVARVAVLVGNWAATLVANSVESFAVVKAAEDWVDDFAALEAEYFAASFVEVKVGSWVERQTADFAEGLVGLASVGDFVGLEFVASAVEVTERFEDFVVEMGEQFVRMTFEHSADERVEELAGEVVVGFVEEQVGVLVEKVAVGSVVGLVEVAAYSAETVVGFVGETVGEIVGKVVANSAEEKVVVYSAVEMIVGFVENVAAANFAEEMVAVFAARVVVVVVVEESVEEQVVCFVEEMVVLAVVLKVQAGASLVQAVVCSAVSAVLVAMLAVVSHWFDSVSG